MHVELIYFKALNVYQKLGKLKEALEDYDRAIKLNPSNYDYYYNRGNLLYEM